MLTNRKSRMQIMIPFAYALANFWYNLSFYGDLLFILVRTLFIMTMTHLIAWSRKSELDDEEETMEPNSEPGLDDESAFRTEDGVEEEFVTSMCAERRRRIARLVAGVQWHHRGRRFRPRRD